MSRRKTLIAAAAGVAALSGGAVAVAASAGNSATLTAVSGTKVKINHYIQDSAHYSPGVVTIKSGGTLTLRLKGASEHTFSIVKKTQQPKTAKQVEQCKVCGSIATAHGVDPNGPPTQGPPPNPVVDVGSTGVDQAGDSVYFNKTTKVKITAKKGTTLYFMCAIHPWMQGRLQVK